MLPGIRPAHRRILPMDRVPQPSRLRVHGASSPQVGPGGETPPELAGEDACATRARRCSALMRVQSCWRWTLSVLTLAAWLGMLAGAKAQVFSSGSTGAYGPMNITTNTILLVPTNGIFHCTTLNVAAGATLTFTRNSLNTPIYLLATGDVTISGVIDVSGKAGRQALAGEGGAGGFNGGEPATSDHELPGDGQGPGAGKAQSGNSSNSSAAGDAAYGGVPGNNTVTNGGGIYGAALLIPIVGGSGGGGGLGSPGYGGGGGGGAILIASSTKVVLAGSINAAGGNGTPFLAGGGSGGGIRLVAPVTAGTGGFSVQGGSGSGYRPPNYIIADTAGVGRIRIDSPDRSNWNFTFTGRTTYGNTMVVFPAVVPQLNIIEVAGQAISAGATGAVEVGLPGTASTNQTVKIQARDFTGPIPIFVVVTPFSGPASTYSAVINMSAGSVATVTVPIVLPVGVTSRIHAWTR